MIIYNVNFQDIRKLMVNNEWDRIGEELANIANVLENAGADYIVIATNTMHKLADYIQDNINVPLIHIADCVANKCIESNVLDVLLLGTKYTMVEDFLTNRLAENGLTVTTPKNEEEINGIDKIIFDELCKGEIKQESKEYYINVINKMIEENNIEEYKKYLKKLRNVSRIMNATTLYDKRSILVHYYGYTLFCRKELIHSFDDRDAFLDESLVPKSSLHGREATPKQIGTLKELFNLNEEQNVSRYNGCEEIKR